VQAFLRFSSRACAKANERPGGQVARDILAGLFADAIRAAGPSATRSTASRPPWSLSPSYSPRSANDVAPQRRAAIAANSELQERELLKRARLASAIADALRARRADDTTVWQLMPKGQPGRRVRPLSSSHRSYRRRGR
jgi:hypothetical protein